MACRQNRELTGGGAADRAIDSGGPLSHDRSATGMAIRRSGSSKAQVDRAAIRIAKQVYAET